MREEVTPVLLLRRPDCTAGVVVRDSYGAMLASATALSAVMSPAWLAAAEWCIVRSTRRSAAWPDPEPWAAGRPCACGGEGTVERLATPEEVDAGCELGIAFDPCPACSGRD